MPARFSIIALALFVASACAGPDLPRARESELPRPVSDPGTGAAVGGGRDRETRPAAEGESALTPERELPLVAFLGDSLTAGYGLAIEEAYPAHVERLLAERGLATRIVNAGVSGDTSAGGRERLDWLLRLRPSILVVELGGNDGLRGQPVAATEDNLRAILERARAAGVEVLLVGMRIPPSFGPEYVSSFEEIYPRLAREHDVSLLPFLLEGVAAVPELNQPDGIHPNAQGHRVVARTVADALAPLVEAARAAP